MPRNMQYDEVTAKAGSSKKKGSAKESMAVPAEKLETIQNTEGGGRKKGGAKHIDGTDKGHKGGGKKKGSAQVGYDAIISHGKDLKKKRDKVNQENRNNNFNAGILDSISMEHSGQGQKAREMYGKNYGQISGEGENAKYIGEKESVKASPEALKAYMDFKIPGATRGYTQNFGPARGNSYAKGAAKVAQIMGKGAAEYGGKKGDDSKSKKDYEG